LYKNTTLLVAHAKAVLEHLAKGKLSTTPYDGEQAHTEFAFINPSFCPLGKPDPCEHEGGTCDEIAPAVGATRGGPNSIPIHIPVLPTMRIPKASADTSKPLLHEHQALSNITNTHATPPLTIWISFASQTNRANKENSKEHASESDEEGMESCIFCPSLHWPKVIEMLELHFCTHLLIPGYSALTPEGI
jgi:hypothetical protein